MKDHSFTISNFITITGWWTINPWGYHPPSSRCFGIDTV